MDSSSDTIGGSQKKKCRKMMPYEDEILCQCYIQVSTNPIVGNSQTSATFWEIVTNTYNEHPGISGSPRPMSSLQSKYSIISKAVMLYVAKLSTTYSEYQSGTNELDWINKAREDYQKCSVGNKPFMYDGCYQILKDLPKFDIATTRRMNPPPNPMPFNSDGNTSSPGTPTSNRLGAINLDDDSSSPNDIEAPCMRPPGRKGEKQRTKRKQRTSNLAANEAILESCEAFNSVYAQTMSATLNSRAHLEAGLDSLVKMRQEELEIMKKTRQEDLDMAKKKMEHEMDIALRKEEDEIMRTDTSNMSGPQKQYFESRYQEIMYRRMRRAQQNPTTSYSPI